MTSVDTFLCRIIFLIIFNANFRLWYLQYPKRIVSKVPCNVESYSIRDFRLSQELQSLYSLSNMSTNILLSNGEDRGDSGEKSGEQTESKEEPQAEEKKEEPAQVEETKEEPRPPEQAEEAKTSAMEEERRETPGIPPVPETKSRIPTYDQFARYRNSSVPPDSHYYGPPGPGPFDRRRARGTAIKCHLLLTILGVGTSLDRAFLF